MGSQVSFASLQSTFCILLFLYFFILRTSPGLANLSSQIGSKNRLSSNHAGPVRRPVAGDNYVTVTKGMDCGTKWLLTPLTNHRRRTSIRIRRSMAGKRLMQQQTNKRESLSPRRITRKTRTRSVVCAAAENEDTAPTNLPHRHRSRLFPLAKTFPDRRRDGGRLFRRREKREMRLLTSKLNSQISHTFKPCPLQNIGWGGSVKEIRS